MLDALSRTPFVDSTELALILGAPHATVHRTLADLLADGIVGRVSHSTAHLPSRQRYHLTAQGIRTAAESLGFDTPTDFVRAYPMSREWLTLLIRRMGCPDRPSSHLQAQRIPVRWYNVRVPLFSWNDDKNQLLQEQREVGSSVLHKYVSDLEAAG